MGADRGPGLLRDRGVVVLLVGLGAGAGDRLGALGAVADQMPLEALGPVVAVAAAEREGPGRLEGDARCQAAARAFPPDRALCRPAGGQVDESDGADALPGQRIPTRGDGSGLQAARPSRIPRMGLNQERRLEERAWCGGGEPLTLHTHSLVGQQAVHGRRRSLGQSRGDPGSQRMAGLLGRCDPTSPDGLEACGAGGVRGGPEPAQHFQDLRLGVA